MEGIGCEHVKNIHENSHVRKTTAPAIALIPKMGWEIRPKISLCSSSRLSNQTYRMRARWNMIAGRLMRLPQALLADIHQIAAGSFAICPGSAF